MKKFFISVVFIVLLTFTTFINSATAAELDDNVRTLPLNEDKEEVVLTIKEFTQGKRQFTNVCSQCHVGGITKTNPDVSLDPETLALAYPARDNIEGLIDYMQNPTTYDGFIEISEFHPSIKSADIYPEMRNLTEDDLYAIAGYILVQPKVLGKQWGGGKIFR
ncbi:MAG: photosystem II cytochrome c-550 [Trichodesmium sp. St16_bin4-tuft]|nr:cytochrome c-550 [Trichodesmium sp. MAG_R01]MDE5070002.1 photosystem II cytochrome c-550 [Trichodesmium sp. St4_bin8_1]MDE5072274.1 photosystem II cytochrome c-550 [Trichodesmium sp. St5_bin8]MDE5091040.1 photosystem II cytochrome c-550 [Trichodesmium sp. St18_bin3_1_1]MDE5097605.1 photosystem II cytochrome c-550 [Trichodesmium sp. St16_bin4-tuft]MDE5104314.1 photosystem II cytochrome c-550 [Trichodesmium sp. St19_bin2]